jgi:hypothetical protein
VFHKTTSKLNSFDAMKDGEYFAVVGTTICVMLTVQQQKSLRQDVPVTTLRKLTTLLTVKVVKNNEFAVNYYFHVCTLTQRLTHNSDIALKFHFFGRFSSDLLLLL